MGGKKHQTRQNWSTWAIWPRKTLKTWSAHLPASHTWRCSWGYFYGCYHGYTPPCLLGYKYKPYNYGYAYEIFWAAEDVRAIAIVWCFFGVFLVFRFCIFFVFFSCCFLLSCFLWYFAPSGCCLLFHCAIFLVFFPFCYFSLPSRLPLAIVFPVLLVLPTVLGHCGTLPMVSVLVALCMCRIS